MYILDSFSTPEIAIDLGTANTRIGAARTEFIESVTQLPDATPGWCGARACASHAATCTSSSKTG
ncbi:MAG: hypothetical protein ACYC7A_08860 [Thermoanaerobaculia bacterium]